MSGYEHGSGGRSPGSRDGAHSTCAPSMARTNNLKTNGQDLKPREHSFASTWRDATETSQFKFAKDGTLQTYKKYNDDGSVEDKMPAKDVYENGAIDSCGNGKLESTQRDMLC